MIDNYYDVLRSAMKDICEVQIVDHCVSGMFEMSLYLFGGEFWGFFEIHIYLR